MSAKFWHLEEQCYGHWDPERVVLAQAFKSEASQSVDNRSPAVRVTSKDGPQGKIR